VQAGLSVRLLAKELDRAHSTISDLRMVGACRASTSSSSTRTTSGWRDVAHSASARAKRLESPRDAIVRENLGEVVCPYMALRAFELGAAPLFFGREIQIDELLASLTASRLVAVIGASGSGKSGGTQHAPA